MDPYFWLGLALLVLLFAGPTVLRNRRKSILHRQITFSVGRDNFDSGRHFSLVEYIEIAERTLNVPQPYRLTVQEEYIACDFIREYSSKLSTNYLSRDTDPSYAISRLKEEEFFYVSLYSFLCRHQGFEFCGHTLCTPSDKPPEPGSLLRYYNLTDSGRVLYKLLYTTSLYCVRGGKRTNSVAVGTWISGSRPNEYGTILDTNEVTHTR